MTMTMIVMMVMVIVTGVRVQYTAVLLVIIARFVVGHNSLWEERKEGRERGKAFARRDGDIEKKKKMERREWDGGGTGKRVAQE